MSSSDSQTPSDPQSYSTMATGDVDSIGAHCQAAFCHQLDFLPFKCESCKGTFCLDHRTETAHACPKAGEWARRRHQASSSSSSPSATPYRKPNILSHESQCSSPACKTLINTPLVPGIDCPTCNRSYCLKHRLQEDHDCANLTPRGARAGGAQQKSIGDALGKLRAWGAAKKAAASASASAPASSSSGLAKTTTASSTGSTHSATLTRIISPFTSRKAGKQTQSAQVVAVNKLKQTAKGDAKIAAEKRVYVHLEAVAEGEGRAGAKVPRGDAFFSREWSVGKVLDVAAKQLTVTNVNNRGGGEKERLRVYHVEGGKLLEFSEKLGTGVKDADTLVLLRGVGAEDAQ